MVTSSISRSIGIEGMIVENSLIISQSDIRGSLTSSKEINRFSGKGFGGLVIKFQFVINQIRIITNRNDDTQWF